MNYKNLLKSKKFKIGIWGTGYIGLSTMVLFFKKILNVWVLILTKKKLKK